MSYIYKDEEWGFFIDLELEYENTAKTFMPKKDYLSKRNNINYLNTIYEDNWWYENDTDSDYTDATELKTITENDKNKTRLYSGINNEKTKTTALIMYCIICASVISMSLLV